MFNQDPYPPQAVPTCPGLPGFPQGKAMGLSRERVGVARERVSIIAFCRIGLNNPATMKSTDPHPPQAVPTCPGLQWVPPRGRLLSPLPGEGRRSRGEGEYRHILPDWAEQSGYDEVNGPSSTASGPHLPWLAMGFPRGRLLSPLPGEGRRSRGEGGYRRILPDWAEQSGLQLRLAECANKAHSASHLSLDHGQINTKALLGDLEVEPIALQVLFRVGDCCQT